MLLKGKTERIMDGSENASPGNTMAGYFCSVCLGILAYRYLNILGDIVLWTVY